MKAHIFTTQASSTQSPFAHHPHSALLSKLEQLHYEQGEKRLMLAVLKDAVACIENYHPHVVHGTHGWLACRAAIGWVLSHERRWPFSFENICAALELDPARLRSALCTPLLPLLIKSHANTSLPKV